MLHDSVIWNYGAFLQIMESYIVLESLECQFQRFRLQHHFTSSQFYYLEILLQFVYAVWCQQGRVGERHVAVFAVVAVWRV